MKKSTLLTTLLAAPVLMGTSLSAATYTMIQDGRIGLGSNYSSPAFTDFATEVTSDDVLIVDGVAATTNGTSNYNETTINVIGAGSLAVPNNQVISNVTINVQDTATLSSLNGANARFQNSTINYDSSAVSTSTGEFKLNSGTTLNLNNGGLVLNSSALKSDGSDASFEMKFTDTVLNMNGGDLTFDSFFFSDNANTFISSAINFDSTADSIITFTGASTINDFDFYLDEGFIQLDGETVVDNAGFDVVFDGQNLSLSVASAAVPEPSSTALLGLGGLAMLLRRRRG